ncbi:MAG: 50S ribosomal protein L30e [Candidatus Micrarchaeia archaeon]
MVELNNGIRLAVDSGKVAIGANKVVDSIKANEAKLVVVAKKGDKVIIEDITHMAKISDIKVVEFDGDSMQLGAVCGKPFSVSALSIIEQGNSSILDEIAKEEKSVNA